MRRIFGLPARARNWQNADMRKDCATHRVVVPRARAPWSPSTSPIRPGVRLRTDLGRDVRVRRLRRRGRAWRPRAVSTSSCRLGLDALERATRDGARLQSARGAPAGRRARRAAGGARARARIVSVCTGAFALADAGLLDGRRATTHWRRRGRARAALAARRGRRPNVLYVHHGDVVTSAGVAAGIDLCLHLVRADHGAGVGNAIARRIVVAPYREGSQAQSRRARCRSRRGGLAATRAWRSSGCAAADRGRDGGHAGLEWHRSPGTSVPRRARRRCAGCTRSACCGARAARADASWRSMPSRSRAASAPRPRCALHLGRAAATTPTAHRRAFTRARPAASPGRAERPRSRARQPFAARRSRPSAAYSPNATRTGLNVSMFFVSP